VKKQIGLSAVLLILALLLTGCGTGQARAAEPPALTPLP